VRDIDIRQALHETRLAIFKRDPDTVVIDELGLCQGNARIDIAVINGRLHGFEIKSEKDTLERLPTQEKIYSKILDTVTLVTHQHHIDKASQIIPDWWGIISAGGSASDLTLEQFRPARVNQCIDPNAVVQLLWRDEALDILASFNLTKGLKSKPRSFLWKTLADQLSIVELCEVVRRTIKKRKNWRSDPPQNICADSHLP
jgi:hypothetical protein